MSNLINMFQKIKKAKKVMIVSDAKDLALSCALYTYVLMQHKGVSLICKDKSIDAGLSFLPWFDKIKREPTKSADLIVDIDFTVLDFYTALKSESIRVNKKMATALYAAIIIESDGFLNPDANGMIFAVLKELIDSGAEYKLCTKNLLQRESLALLRLKSLMFKSMLLRDSATTALFKISDDDLRSSGATMQDCDAVLKEALCLPYVERAVVQDSKENILKIKEK